MNDEQNVRATELDRVNMFLEGILGNLGVGVAVVDREQRIEVWNAASYNLWGLHPSDVEGRALMALDIGLPVERLAEAIRDVIGARGDPATLVIDAVDRRGHKFRCAVRVLPLQSQTGDVEGAVILMGDADEPAQPGLLATGAR